MTLTVDTFVDQTLQPEFRDLAQSIRTLMHDCAPQAEEYVTYGLPGWRVRNMLAVLKPEKAYVTLAFSNGASFEDPYGLLTGVGHVSRHIKLKSVDELREKEEAVRCYVAQALAFDARKTGAG